MRALLTPAGCNMHRRHLALTLFALASTCVAACDDDGATPSDAMTLDAGDVTDTATPEGQACVDLDDCGGDYECGELKRCVIRVVRLCETVDDCLAGQTCFEGADSSYCVWPCQTHDECPHELYCEPPEWAGPDGRSCTPGSHTPCESHDDCETDQRCDENAGLCLYGCRGDEDCPAGNACDDFTGVCRVR